MGSEQVASGVSVRRGPARAADRRSDTVVRRVGAADVRAILARPGQLQLVFQPIVDLNRGVVVGHEVLSRFPQRPGSSAGPDAWFAAAESAGLGADLNALVLRAVVRLLPNLPEDTFVTVNVDPPALFSPQIDAVLADTGSLARLVVEITEHTAVENFDDMFATLTRWRARGAKIALDDVGSGYAGLQALLRLRPEIVKVDRALVDGMDLEPAKRAVVEMLGHFAGDLGAWLLAEGVEQLGELVECVRLGVPLGQGWVFGRPSLGWTQTLSAPVQRMITAYAEARWERGTVRELVEAVPAVPDAHPAPGGDHPGTVCVAVDEYRRPVRLFHRCARDGRWHVTEPLLVKPSERVPELVRRAVARGQAHWHEPVVCCADDGTYLGVLRVDRLVDDLARTAAWAR